MTESLPHGSLVWIEVPATGEIDELKVSIIFITRR